MTHSINNEHSLFENQYHVGGCLKSPSGLKKESPIQKCRGIFFVP